MGMPISIGLDLQINKLTYKKEIPLIYDQRDFFFIQTYPFQ